MWRIRLPVSCGIALSVGIAWAVKRWEHKLKSEKTTPRLRFALHKDILNSLEAFEAAVIDDASNLYQSPPTSSLSQDSLISRMTARSRVILNHANLNDIILHLHFCNVCDADDDLVMRLGHVIMYLATLRVIVQREEAVTLSQELPKSYLPVDVLFSFERLEWEESLLEVQAVLEKSRSTFIASRNNCSADDSTRSEIMRHFFDAVLPRMRCEVDTARNATARLAISKLVYGFIGPVVRHPHRHARLIRHTVGLVLGVGVLEVLSFFSTSLIMARIYDCLSLVSASVKSIVGDRWFSDEDGASSSSSSSITMIAPQFLFFWMSTLALDFVQMVVRPWTDDIAAELRSVMSTEWSYELAVRMSEADEALTSQREFHHYTYGSIARTCSSVADRVVRTYIRGLGRCVGALAVIGIGQLWFRDKSIPVVAAACSVIDSVTTSLLERVLGSSDELPRFSYQLEALEQRGTGKTECGVRLMLQVVAELHFEDVAGSSSSRQSPFSPSRQTLKHPHLALLCCATTSCFGDASSMAILDRKSLHLEPLMRLFHNVCSSIRKFNNANSLNVSLKKQVSFAHLMLLEHFGTLTYSSAANYQAMSAGDVAISRAQHHLDPEEVQLFTRGLSYIRPLDASAHGLFQERRFVTLRILGLEVLHAYRSVIDSFAKNRRRATKELSLAFRDFRFQQMVAEELLRGLKELVLHFSVIVLVRNLLPQAVTPTPVAHDISAHHDSTYLISKEYLMRIAAYRSVFSPSGAFHSLFKGLYAMHNAPERMCFALEEILQKLPQISDAADKEHMEYRGRVRSVVSAQRPELLFNEHHRICGGFVLQEKIEMHRVCFRYPTSTSLVLDHVSFCAPVKLFTAIMGKTGSGKSTIAHLLTGRNPQLRKKCTSSCDNVEGEDQSKSNLSSFDVEGEITLDGIPLRCFDSVYAKQLIVGVPQSPVIIESLTFAQNIAMFRPVTFAEVQWAAKMARCDVFILEQAGGYDSLPKKLSGGEKQRIEIARAIVTRPQILILDEATSKLDARNEEKIQRTLNTIATNGVCTMIAIAHRLSTLKKADKYVVLHEGRVLEQGTHDELMEENDEAPAAVPQVNDVCPVVPTVKNEEENMTYKAQMGFQRLSNITASKVTFSNHVSACLQSSPPIDAWSDEVMSSLLQTIAAAGA